MTEPVSVKRRLPVEMQNRAQWCLAGLDKAPFLAGSNGVYHASPVTGPWLDFDTALSYATQHNMGIGYVLTADDPYTCIDMDVKDIESKDKDGKQIPSHEWTHKSRLDYYSGLMQFAGSYSELSASGKGLHIWVKGDIGAGRRGNGLEVYSRERFIVCTGIAVSHVEYDIINNHAIPKLYGTTALPIADGTLLLQNLTKELGTAGGTIALEEIEEVLTDAEIWTRASCAMNKEKFQSLCEGDWSAMFFPSQSEADLALLSMFTFYSKSNEQCRRLFRQTGLGQRDKATKNDVYLNRTLKIIRGRQATEKATIEHGASIAKALLDAEKLKPQALQKTPSVNPTIRNAVLHMDQAQHSAPNASIEVNYDLPLADGLEWPPGLVGAIAGFIYQSAPRPVKEVAIVAALGLMAGIVGKAYNISQTGLNLYIILIARSGIGKETMHSGIGHILRSPCGQMISPFINYTDYVSGPALTKAMEESTSFVNVSGEWGRKLQRMAEDNRDGAMQQLRTVMTNLYQKSGAASVMGGLGYSNKEQNVKSINAVAYSMIGETTPGTFYNSLTNTMMEDGFLSRFNIVEYSGDRPPENKTPLIKVPAIIHEALAKMAPHAMSVARSPTNTAIQVVLSQEADTLYNQFNLFCDSRINEAREDESIRQIWNRAHLKALRVGGVLAAADNYQSPVVTADHAKWALLLIKADTSAMLNKIQAGDVGADDNARFKKLLSILKHYLQKGAPASYKIDRRMTEEGVIPRKLLQAKTSQLRCFLNYRMGPTLALDHTIKTAIDSGYIMEIDKGKAVQKFEYHGRCFRVLEL